MEKSESQIEFDEKEYLRKFDPIQMALWLQIVACHPNNGLYILRVEYLLGLLLSIPSKEFGKEIADYDSVFFLFENISEYYEELFSTFEDFEGYDQTKLIPLFFKRKKYFFFYGNLERPYEEWMRVTEIYFYNDTSKELLSLEEDMLSSLSFQTRLLNQMIVIEESFIKTDGFYVPSQIYFDKLNPLFKMGYQTLDESRMKPMKLGELVGCSADTVLNKTISTELFSSTYLKDGHDTYYFYPQTHTKILLDSGRRKMQKSSALSHAGYLSFKSRLSDLCLKFFGSYNCVAALLEKGSNENLIDGLIDFAVIVDSTKIFLFSACKYGFTEDISKILKKHTDYLIKLRKRIKNNEIIGIAEYDNRVPYGVYTKELEIWLIPVYEPLTFNLLAGFGDKSSDYDHIALYQHRDLRMVFEKIGDPFDFMKFVKEDDELKRKVTFNFMGEFMDKFSFYMGNGKSFSRSGVQFSGINFVPHIWSEEIFNELYEKHLDDIYEEIETKIPNFFNKIEKYKEGVYRVLNTAHLSGGYIIKWRTRFIWLYLPPFSLGLGSQELKFAADLVAPLLSAYLSDLENEFENFFSVVGIHNVVEFSVNVLPKSAIDKEKDFNFLKQYLRDLEKEKVIFKTMRVGSLYKVKTFIIFEPNTLFNLLGKDDNTGEKLLIKNFLKSLLFYAGYDLQSAEEKSESFVNLHIPLGKRGYSVQQLQIANPWVDDYENPIPMNETDVSVVNRQLSEFIIGNNIAQGDYTGKEAKEVNYKFYCFLQKMLEDELSQYSPTLIKFAYQQLELTEGAKTMRAIAYGMRAKGELNYDIHEAYRKEDSKNSELSLSIKHIIHSTLKIGGDGLKEIVTAEIWTKLLAISRVLIDTAEIYDYIQYDLRGHILRINHLYVVEDIEGDEAIDSESFVGTDARIKIDNAKRAYQKATEELPKYTKVEPYPESLNELNEAFKKDLGFSYDDLNFILYALSRMTLFTPGSSPITICTSKEIVEALKKADKLSITDETVLRVLGFLSLRYGMYDKSDLLSAADMMRKKERINVSPLIAIGSSTYLYGNEVVGNALKFWSKPAYGDFPFSTDNLPAIRNAITNIHRNADLELEKEAEIEAGKILGSENVEARVRNFKRLSDEFSRDEKCGEIDVLCVNPEKKVLHVFEVKNVKKGASPYYVRQNIKEFFEGDKSHYSKLLAKKEFVENNLPQILKHFKIESSIGWTVKEAFVTQRNYYAAYWKEKKVDFILVDELGNYLL